jgi:hypothetical protein
MDEYDEGERWVKPGDGLIVTTEESTEVGTLVSLFGGGIVLKVTHRAALKVDEVSLEEEEEIRLGVESLGWRELVVYAVKRHGLGVRDLLVLRNREALVEECVARAVLERVEASERVVLKPVVSPVTKFIPGYRVVEMVDFASWETANMFEMLDFAASLPRE